MKFSKTFPFFSQPEKSYTLSGHTVVIIDNSQLIDISINDKLKLDQIIRRYPALFEPPYQQVRIIFSDELQDLTFSWSSGTAFSHSVDLFTVPNLDITLNINPEVLKNEGWSLDQVEKETEGILITALERALMNINPETSTTYTEQEEAIKSNKIESLTQQAVNQINIDNPNKAFTISYE